jgi:glutathione reductase (NADPH)
MSFDYDLFVIGGGSGGVRAARVAASDTGGQSRIG